MKSVYKAIVPEWHTTYRPEYIYKSVLDSVADVVWGHTNGKVERRLGFFCDLDSFIRMGIIFKRMSYRNP